MPRADASRATGVSQFVVAARALRLPPLTPAIELRSFEARDGKDCPIARQRPDSGRSREARRRSASTAAHGRNGRIPTPRPDKRRGLRIPSPASHGTEGAGNHGQRPRSTHIRRSGAHAPPTRRIELRKLLLPTAAALLTVGCVANEPYGTYGGGASYGYAYPSYSYVYPSYGYAYPAYRHSGRHHYKDHDGKDRRRHAWRDDDRRRDDDRDRDRRRNWRDRDRDGDWRDRDRDRERHVRDRDRRERRARSLSTKEQFDRWSARNPGRPHPRGTRGPIWSDD